VDTRTQEIINRFDQSWTKTVDWLKELYAKKEEFSFLKQMLDLLSSMRQSGEWKHFRLGTSMHALMFSRSVDHGLRDDQKYIYIEYVNDLPDGYEYEVIMRDANNTYRTYRVRNLQDECVIKLFKTLESLVVD
jgi:hypothetical protein